ncbi:MAG TPA: protein-methionine-sulfoxide reductase heme-binding subunit MsrQ [Candidatus Acidoferrales bacterium]|jgi:sulfoxide reductase heme-binding subunit YedZ|nr:protein-methionine-sulfoxide reductase heme-binding subunit MsrQ [Candidatus Acidoferrales bacterium]
MLRKPWAKVPVWLLSLTPACWLAWRAYHNDLTANPIEYITHFTGDWAIRFVVITLAITPLRKLLKLPDLIKFRRLLGLFAFFYGTLHFLTWFGLDKFFDIHEILADFAKRRFITMGLLTFLSMIPLAVTSTTGWIRRLGGKRWQRLHKLIYVTGIAAVIHYYWLVKSDIRLPLLYGTLVGLLLLYRIVTQSLARKAKSTPTPKRAAQTA